MENIKFGNVLKSKKLTTLVAATVVALTLASTKVHADTIVSRLNGTNRYETAAKVCQDGWKEATDYAVIVNGEDFPDALSAAPLAKKFDAPVLLTGKDTLSPYTSVEINRLNVKNVFIIGGRGVVSQSIEDGLKARNIKVTRFGGANRYETALQVAAKIGKPKQIALVNGNDFRDGISISSIAAIKGMPIILTDKDSMPSSVSKYLQSNKKADQIYVVGGTDKISDSIISNLPNTKRIGSGDSYGINTGVIQAFQDEISTSTLYIASAKNFPDSLGASALAPKTFSPVLFVDNPMSEDTKRFLKSNIVNNLKVLGGTGAVTYETEQIAKNLPLGVSQTENMTDTIWQNEKYTPRATMVIIASDGNKKEVSVDWNLTKVNTTKPGIYTFTGKIQGTNKTVYTTLIVKPLPYKIDDLIKTAHSKDSYSLPKTIEAQMTDGTKSQVPVTWDYGTQQGNKPGIYTFYGTVEKYDKKVKLTLNTNSTPADTIASIIDFKKEFETTENMNSYIRNSMPNKVTAKMVDGSTKNLNITWDPASSLTNEGSGKHIIKGSVDGYSGKVNYIMYVKSEGGQDPDKNDPGNSGGETTPGDNTGTDVKLDSMNVIQGNSYDLPKTIIDPSTKKSVKIDSWNTKTIDTKGVDSEDYDKCAISIINFEGTINGSKNKATITVYIKPRIISVDQSDLIINIKTSNTKYELPDTIHVIVADGQKKKAKVTSWDKPYVNANTPKTYYIKGTVEYLADPILVNLTVSE